MLLVDPIQRITAKLRLEAKEMGIYTDELEKLITKCNLYTREMCGNKVHHIQKAPTTRYLVSVEWESLYKKQFENGHKTKNTIASEIYDSISSLVPNVTEQQVNRLLSDRELEITKRKVDFNNGLINEDTLEDGVVYLKKGLVQTSFEDFEDLL